MTKHRATKEQVEAGAWNTGGTKAELDHFWPADYPTTLCGLTSMRHLYRGQPRCGKCAGQRQAILERTRLKRRRHVRGKTELRSDITQLTDIFREWHLRQAAKPEVMIAALWIVNLAGVANSGVPYSAAGETLLLMRGVAKGKVDQWEALEEMKGMAK